MIDDEDARRHALAALPDMAWDEMPEGNDRTFRVVMKDENGRLIYEASLVLQGKWVDSKVR